MLLCSTEDERIEVGMERYCMKTRGQHVDPAFDTSDLYATGILLEILHEPRAAARLTDR